MTSFQAQLFAGVERLCYVRYKLDVGPRKGLGPGVMGLWRCHYRLVPVQYARWCSGKWIVCVNPMRMYKKGQHMLLRSFNVCNSILQMFSESIVASVILYAVVCWGCNTKVCQNESRQDY